jgi:hypothetical protein
MGGFSTNSYWWIIYRHWFIYGNLCGPAISAAICIALTGKARHAKIGP